MSKSIVFCKQLCQFLPKIVQSHQIFLKNYKIACTKLSEDTWWHDGLSDDYRRLEKECSEFDFIYLRRLK